MGAVTLTVIEGWEEVPFLRLVSFQQLFYPVLGEMCQKSPQEFSEEGTSYEAFSKVSFVCEYAHLNLQNEVSCVKPQFKSY